MVPLTVRITAPDTFKDHNEVVVELQTWEFDLRSLSSIFSFRSPTKGVRSCP